MMRWLDCQQRTVLPEFVHRDHYSRQIAIVNLTTEELCRVLWLNSHFADGGPTDPLR